MSTALQKFLRRIQILHLGNSAEQLIGYSVIFCFHSCADNCRRNCWRLFFFGLDSSGNSCVSYYDSYNGDLKYASIVGVLPTGSISINSGDQYTTSRFVMLKLTYSATSASVNAIRCSNDGVWDTETWIVPQSNQLWTLTAGDGEKTVF